MQSDEASRVDAIWNCVLLRMPRAIRACLQEYDVVLSTAGDSADVVASAVASTITLPPSFAQLSDVQLAAKLTDGAVAVWLAESHIFGLDQMSERAGLFVNADDVRELVTKLNIDGVVAGDERTAESPKTPKVSMQDFAKWLSAAAFANVIRRPPPAWVPAEVISFVGKLSSLDRASQVMVSEISEVRAQLTQMQGSETALQILREAVLTI